MGFWINLNSKLHQFNYQWNRITHSFFTISLTQLEKSILIKNLNKFPRLNLASNYNVSIISLAYLKKIMKQHFSTDISIFQLNSHSSNSSNHLFILFCGFPS
ncbi:hypothetical protein BpHYR1_043016 [Brachionus plicatilis]|uniref:Uncharacterized protein n=1 Tax=Brachionus plicatilis TaxID=10195 RepID=A0A3M7QL40_BRAPC|nr:hypothetical protein BpHYR1_043016 [Brachionus plicatilis]